MRTLLLSFLKKKKKSKFQHLPPFEKYLSIFQFLKSQRLKFIHFSFPFPKVKPSLISIYNLKDTFFPFFLPFNINTKLIFSSFQKNWNLQQLHLSLLHFQFSIINHHHQPPSLHMCAGACLINWMASEFYAVPDPWQSRFDARGGVSATGK